MDIKVTAHQRRSVVELRGRFDAHEVDAFVAEVDQLRGHGTVAYAIDLSAVDFIDSSALAALVSLNRRATAEGGAVELLCVSDSVRVILELTGLDETFVINDASEPPPIARR